MSMPLKSVWHRVKPYIPQLFTKGRFNFITIHYLYICGMTLLGSVIIFSIGDMPYIDALVFGSGGSTQSGLNTVDINTIHTGQQFVLYVLGNICNPIVIHSSVVFIRLHWFEKRFKHVVEEARLLRRSKSRSRVVSKTKDDPELGRQEKGVRGRSIVVLRDGHAIEGSLEEEQAKADAIAESPSTASAHDEIAKGSSDTAQAGIPLEERVQDAAESPVRLNHDHHIAFLENQRSPKNKGALRIPSPREFDRGGRPEDVDDQDVGLARRVTSRYETNHFGHTPQSANHITINEPKISRSRERGPAVPEVESDKIGTASSVEPSASMFSRVRSRQGSNIKNLVRVSTTFLRPKEQEPKDEAPYLSWVPTIVRNSAFVNLDEQQREELGGIEYRALKTLAIVLLSYYAIFHLLGLICLTPWIIKSGRYGPIVQGFGIGGPWWGVFTAASAFNDLGFTLTPDSMISFGSAIFPILLMTFLILIGNTGFPCMLRFVIWLTSKLVPRGSGLWEELQFLLDHPRRCFTLLFPRAATWWLFAILVILNWVDVILFIILDVSPCYLLMVDNANQNLS
jgi:Cation transport protein